MKWSKRIPRPALNIFGWHAVINLEPSYGVVVEMADVMRCRVGTLLVEWEQFHRSSILFPVAMDANGLSKN